MNKKDSDSGFGSSYDSSMSRLSSVDAQFLELGNLPIKMLARNEFLTQIFINCFKCISFIIEAGLLVYYMGYDALREYLLYQVALQVQSILIMAAAKGGSQISQKSLAKNQILIANTYFAHAKLVEVVCMAVGALFAVTFSSVPVQTTYAQNYIVLRSVGGGFIQIFHRAQFEYYKIENRTFLIFCQEFFSFLVYVGFMCIIIINDSLVKLSFNSLAIPYLISHGIVFLWSLYSIGHIQIFDMQYRGALKFSIKRLSPLRPKFFVSIIIRTVANFIIDAPIAIAMAVIVRISYTFKVVEMQQQLVVCVFIYLICRYVPDAVSAAGKDTMSILVSFNTQIKKITRVFESLKHGFINQFFLQLMVCIVFLIIAAIVPILPNFVTNVNNQLNFDGLVTQTNIQIAAGVSVVSSFFPAIYQTVFVFMQLEEMFVWIFCWSLFSLIALGLIMFYLYFLYGEAAPFYYAFAFYEVFVFCCSIGLLDYFFSKYRALYKVNINLKGNQNEKQLQNETNQEDAKRGEDLALRSQISTQLAQEEEEKQGGKPKLTSMQVQIFNKNLALRNSNIFVNLRSSVVQDSLRGSQVLISSKTNYDSTIRDSQTFLHVKPGSQTELKQSGSTEKKLGDDPISPEDKEHDKNDV